LGVFKLGEGGGLDDFDIKKRNEMSCHQLFAKNAQVA